MTMAVVWTGMVLISVVCAILTGRTEILSGAAMEGASQGVNLCASMAGMMCLWMGVMEVWKQSGLAEGLARLLKPLLRRLYPACQREEGILNDIAANVSANLLGLGNAATPFGVSAVRKMAMKTNEYASNDIIMLIVCNTASIQLIPTTVASVRSAAGSANPFDILPAVWLASLISVCVGITITRLLAKVWDRRGK